MMYARSEYDWDFGSNAILFENESDAFHCAEDFLLTEHEHRWELPSEYFSIKKPNHIRYSDESDFYSFEIKVEQLEIK